MRSHRLKLQEGKFRLDIGKIIYTTIVVKYWNRHLESFLGSPSLEILNTQVQSPDQLVCFGQRLDQRHPQILSSLDYSMNLTSSDPHSTGRLGFAGQW